MPDSPHDLFQAAKPLIPSAIGVAAGMFARWGAEAKAGRVKSVWRMVLLDLPTLGALTFVAGSVAQHLQADPVTAAGIGTGAGYLGMQVVDLLVALKTGQRVDRSGGQG